MSAIPVEQIKRNRHETGGLKHIPLPSANETCGRNHICAPPPNVFDAADTVFCFTSGGAT
jgi:hypothetical protein